MVKYYSTSVVFEEIPDEVTLAIEITNCPGNCEGCHSPWLRKDIGEELTVEVLRKLIDDNKGVTCVCFMGEGNDPEALKTLAFSIRMRSDYPYKTGLYSGRAEVEDELNNYFDYIKVGPYIPERGPLNDENTNQRMYEIIDGKRTDITYKFWKRK